MARPYGSTEISRKQERTIVELSLEGKSRPEIADRANVSKTTVYRYQKQHNVRPEDLVGGD